MLVPTMTPEEIYAEMAKDVNDLASAINTRYIPEFAKTIRRTQRFPEAKPYVWVSRKTRIEYILIFVAYRKADHKKVPHFFVYTIYSHETGRNLVYIEPDRFAIRIYTPHFIQRYKERDPALAEALSNISDYYFECAFLLRNHRVKETEFMKHLDETVDDPLYIEGREKEKRSRFWQDPDYERYTVACERGLCLCERNKANPNISIYDTFVAYDMLKPTQYIDFTQAVVPLVLDRIALYYPRQKEFWIKEWNEFADAVGKDTAIDNFEKCRLILAKLDEFNRRYPIDSLL